MRWPAAKDCSNARPCSLKSREQRRRPAVAHAHPEKPSLVAGTISEVEKVLVLRDDDAAFPGSAMPDLSVRSTLEAEVQNVHGMFTARGKPAGERGGELIVHDELHAPARTT